jgi:hypothetical protein
LRWDILTEEKVGTGDQDFLSSSLTKHDRIIERKRKSRPQKSINYDSGKREKTTFSGISLAED